MRTLLRTLLLCLLAPAAVALADEKASAGKANPLSDNNRMLYGGVKSILLRSAEQVPEAHYSYRPTEAVRSFGQILGHVADSQYAFCSGVLGQKFQPMKIEETKTSKADLVAALRDSFAFCDKAYEGMTDTSAAQMINFMGGDKPKLGVLTINTVHTIEHYGNLVTYMRMKDIIPPTSDPEFMKQLGVQSNKK